MNKKAFFGGGEILKWLLILFLVIILIVIIVGPDQLLEKAKDALFSLGLVNLPGDETPGFAGKSIENEELVAYYDGIISGIKTSKDSEGCKIEIGEKPGLDKYSIVFMKGVAQIEKKSKDLTLPYNQKAISDLIPCLYDCSTTCSANKPEKVVINDDINVAQFLYKPDKNTICVVKESDAKKISANQCS
jgi:hypothetical protein